MIGFQPNEEFLVASQPCPTMALEPLCIRLCKNSTTTKDNRALGDSLHIMACSRTGISLQSVAYPSKDCIHIMVDIVQGGLDRLATRSFRRCSITSYYLKTFSTSLETSMICLMSSKGKLYCLIQTAIFAGSILMISDYLESNSFYSYHYFWYF